MVAASLPLKADEAQCKAVLHDCDTAVKALQKENQIQKQIIADEDTRFKTQSTELRREEFWRPLAIGGFVVSIGAIAILIFKK